MRWMKTKFAVRGLWQWEQWECISFTRRDGHVIWPGQMSWPPRTSSATSSHCIFFRTWWMKAGYGRVWDLMYLQWTGEVQAIRWACCSSPELLVPLGQRCLRPNLKLKRRGNPNINITSQLQFLFLSLLLSHKHMHIRLKQSSIPEVKAFLRKESLKIQHLVTFALIAVLVLVSHCSWKNGGEHLND